MISHRTWLSGQYLDGLLEKVSLSPNAFLKKANKRSENLLNLAVSR